MVSVLALVAAPLAAAATSCADVRRDERNFEGDVRRLVEARCRACSRPGGLGLCLSTLEGLLGKRWAPGAMEGALVRGGFACRWAAVAAFRYGPRSVADVEAYVVDGALHASFDAVCGVEGALGLAGGGAAWDSRVPGDAEHKAVVAVRHNGLGNQIFQYAFARLLAASLGAALGDEVVGPAEAAKAGAVPPHTALGAAVFAALFPGRRRDASPGGCAPDAASPTWNATRLRPGPFAGDGSRAVVSERRVDLRARPIRDTLGAALRPGKACVRAIGYFHDDALFRGSRDALREALQLRRLAPGAGGPQPSDVVLHVRLCDKPYHYYAFFGLAYFKPVLDGLLAREPGAVKIVSTCAPDRPGVVRDLLAAYAGSATLVAAPPSATTAADGLAFDFSYLASASRLVVAQSTLSYWAAFLSTAREIHVPLQAAVPTMYWAPEVVLHDAPRGRFFGAVDPETGNLSFATRLPEVAAALPPRPPRPPRIQRGARRRKRADQYT